MSTSAPFPSARMLSSSVPQAIQRRCTFSSLNSTAQGTEKAPCYQCNWVRISFFTDKSKLCQCLCSSMFLWMFFTCSGEEEAPSWSTYVGKMFTAASSYLPAQVSGMMSQDRAFATVRLQMAGQKNVCALAMWVLQSLHSNLEWVTVFTEEKTHSRVSLDLSESRNFHVCLWPPLMGSYSSITSTLKMGVSALWCRSTGEFSLFF